MEELSMKKLFSIIVCIVMILSFSNAVNAEEVSININGMLEYNESISSQNSKLSPEDVEKINKKYAILQHYMQNQNISRATTWTHLPGTFYLYYQTTNYNCGPACVQSAIKYINGTAPSQSTVATGCGTTTNGSYLSNMVTYLNSMQNKNNYVDLYQEGRDTFKFCLYSTIHDVKVPAIVGFGCSKNDGWLYNSNGHVVCINAARDDYEAFQLADPLTGYLGFPDSYAFYQKSTTELYNAYSSVNVGFAW